MLSVSAFFVVSLSALLILEVVEDCFTPWLIHDEGEFILSIFKEFIFSISSFRIVKTIIIHLQEIK